MAYPSGVPTTTVEVSKLYDGVTPRNAASINNGVAQAILDVMNYVNGNNLGTASAPVAAGYITTVYTANVETPSTSWSLKPNISETPVLTLSSDGFGITFDTTGSGFDFLAAVNFSGNVTLGGTLTATSKTQLLSLCTTTFNLGTINLTNTLINATGSTEWNGDFVVDTGHDIEIQGGDLDVQDGVVKNGGFRPSFKEVAGSVSGPTTYYATEADHTFRLTSFIDTATVILPEITTSNQGQEYKFIADGISSAATVVASGSNGFYGFGVAGTTLTFSEGGFCVITAIDTTTLGYDDVWFITAASGVVGS